MAHSGVIILLGYKRRAMKKRITLVLVAFSLINPGHAEDTVPNANWRKIAALRVPIKDVRVVSGNEVEIAGVRCRLFGIEIPDRVKDEAKRFLELYMKDYGAYFSIYNDNAPLNDKDGTPLIWLKGHGNGGWAQETLVQAGLATPSYSGFEGYEFTTPRKEGVRKFDWKACLKDADAAHKAGHPPNVNFKWPQQK